MHSAVLLAGGKSTRMGRDKAALVVAGEPLWRRQLATLRATGPAELFLSANDHRHFAGCEAVLLPDAVPDAGPLAGIAAALGLCPHDWLLVLAVDLPAMTSVYLRALLSAAQRSGRGVVPQQPDGKLEPLAAVYPCSARSLAETALLAGRWKMSDFIVELESKGLVTRCEIEQADAHLFANWNTPADVIAQG